MKLVCHLLDIHFTRIPVAVAALWLIFGLAGMPSIALAQGPQDYIVTFRDGTAPAGRASAVGNAGGTVRATIARVRASSVTLPNEAAVLALQGDPSVLNVIPNRPVFARQRANKKPADKPGGGGGNGGGGGGGGPSDDILPAGVARVTPQNALALTGSGVGVAILDTGIDVTHTDLFVNSMYDFSAFGGSCQDDHGHGTHVGGIVAATNNGSDVVGVAPMATLYCVKVLDSAGSGSDFGVMEGLNWVLTNHALVSPPIKVVNMSLGRPGSLGDNPAMRSLMQQLRAVNVAVVVSAGNDPYTEVSQQVPATYPEVIAVASTTAEGGTNRCKRFNGVVAADTASYFTTDGTLDAQGIGVTVSAPGARREDINRGCRLVSDGILSTQLGGGTTRKSGTSMAAPHVAGIVARWAELQGVQFDAAAIKATLRSTADRIGTAPLDSPSSAYWFDGEREGVAQVPSTTPGS